MSMKKKDICILGAGNMGTALAKLIAENGHNVCIWNHSGDVEPLEQIEKYRENKKYLPHILLPINITACGDIKKSLLSADFIFFAVASEFVLGVAQQCVSFVKKGASIIDVSKGFDHATSESIPNLLKKLFPKHPVLGLSGPIVANQIAHKNPTIFLISANNTHAYKKIEKIFSNDFVKTTYSPDILGVEVLQSVKNIYALGMGIIQGLEWSLNIQSVYITSALIEMQKIQKVLGGKQETVFGIAGLGDFITTAFSPEGRNRTFGFMIGKGMEKEKALRKMDQVVESISALKVFSSMKEIKKLRLPLFTVISHVIQEKISVQEAGKKIFRSLG